MLNLVRKKMAADFLSNKYKKKKIFE